MSYLTRSIGKILDASGWLAKACALTLVGLVTANVLGRYLFSIGNVGLQELEWHLVSPIALLGMSYALHHGEHVRVDVFYEHMRPSFQAAVDIATGVLTLAVSVYLAWLAIPYVYNTFEMGQGSPDPGGLPHRFLLKAFIPIGFGLLGLQAISAVIASADQLRSALRDSSQTESKP